MNVLRKIFDVATYIFLAALLFALTVVSVVMMFSSFFFDEKPTLYSLAEHLFVFFLGAALLSCAIVASQFGLKKLLG